MIITAQDQGPVTILDAKGKLTIGDGDIALRDAVLEALASGRIHLLIDLRHTKKLDSSGIAELVNAHTSVKTRGGALKLVNLPRKVRTPLEITQLLTVFDIFDSRDEALASFETEH